MVSTPATALVFGVKLDRSCSDILVLFAAVGKTRTGQMVPDLVWSCMNSNYHSHYCYMQPNLSPITFPPPTMDPYAAPPRPMRIPSHIELAGQAISLALACFTFHEQHFQRSEQLRLKELSHSFMNFKTVVTAIRQLSRYSDDQVLVLFLHLDEFQKDSYFTLCILRWISDAILSSVFKVCSCATQSLLR